MGNMDWLSIGAWVLAYTTANVLADIDLGLWEWLILILAIALFQYLWQRGHNGNRI